MSFVELLLGWGIVAMLAIGSIVAADPFWGRRRGKPIGKRSRAARADRSDTSRARLARREPHRHLLVRARPDRRLPARVAARARTRARARAAPRTRRAPRAARAARRGRSACRRPKPRWRGAGRVTSNASAFANSRSSRFAAAQTRRTIAPFGIVRPCSVTSLIMRRGSACAGDSQRTISSIAFGDRGPRRARAARAARGARRAARRRSRSGWSSCRCPRRSA